MVSKNKKLFVYLIVFLFVVVGLVSVFFWTYYSFSNKSYISYENSLKDYVHKINELNTTISTLNTNQQPKIEKIKSEMPVLRDDFIDLKNELIKNAPPEKLKDDYDYLCEGLENNINIYKQILAIVSRPDSTEMENSINELKEFRNNCINYYFLIDKNKFQIELPNSCEKFIENIISFANKSVLDRKAKEIIKEQNIEFANNIEDISKRFSSLYKKRDNMDYVLKARSENSNFDDLVSLIDDDKNLLDNLTTDFSKITAPADGSEIKDAFTSILENYKSYLNCFKKALQNEINQSLTGNIDESILTTLYSNSDKARIKLDISFETFAKLFAEFKNKQIY